MLDGKEKGLELPQLERGTMIHEYILQPEEFWKDYEILDFEIPKVKQQKDLCERYSQLKLTDPLENEVSILLKSYRSAYSNNKGAAQQITEARGIVDKYDSYIKYLQIGSTKKVISFADLHMLETIKKNIEDHIAANRLLYDVPTTYTCHNEFHINWELYGIKCKSLLDRVMFDHVNKKIILIDLKTTSDVYNFAHSVETFDYYRQIAFYLCAITWYMIEELNLNPDDYDLEAYIIAVQTMVIMKLEYLICLTKRSYSIEKYYCKTLTEISYHINSGNWEHTRKYYEMMELKNLEPKTLNDF